MEVMYARPRWQVVGALLSEVFPAVLCRGVLPGSPKPRDSQSVQVPPGDSDRRDRASSMSRWRRWLAANSTWSARLVIIDDITERVDLEVQLTQADKLSSIGLLAAGVAHEVNTPLAVISSYTQMLAKQLQSDPQKAGAARQDYKQTFRASEIVNNLLNFSRTSGAELTEVSLNKVISDTLALLEHQFKMAQIEVHSELTSACPRSRATLDGCNRCF